MPLTPTTPVPQASIAKVGDPVVVVDLANVTINYSIPLYDAAGNLLETIQIQETPAGAAAFIASNKALIWSRIQALRPAFAGTVQ